MRTIYLFILLALLLSCGEERVLQLPKVEQTNVHEVLDVSPIYIFYDETMPDSTYFDKSKLISTTNWLVNIDKRLTIKQVLPHLQYLQNKRNKASMHKNEDAKNFFTCNDKSITNLGFLDFTSISYKEENPDLINDIKYASEIYSILYVYADGTISLNSNIENLIINEGESKTKSDFQDIKGIIESIKINKLILCIIEDLAFQDYITIKSYIENLALENALISKNEYIFR